MQLPVLCLWKEVQDISKHMKKALTLVSPLTITSWNFSETRFWLFTIKGVIGQSILSWPSPNNI